ncbi:DUF757-domain-containing protein [Pholiota molesta]|nr:DUF757-domain-containing protein [Pholiota molesta]
MASQFDPNNAQNLMEVRCAVFAVKAVEQAQTYWNLLEKLTKYDDEIFEHMMRDFPELAEAPYDKVVKIDEDWMKSAEGKKRWREFIESYKEKVKDYNFGSLIRTDARDEYGEANTIFVTRIQIARNRLGLNEKAHQIAIEEAAKEKAKKEKEARPPRKRRTAPAAHGPSASRSSAPAWAHATGRI